MATPEGPLPLYRIAAVAPQAPVAEACRSLRTNLRFVLNGKPSVAVMITSPGAGEGKSVTAANLAITFAQAGSRVALVDADLRRPILHHVFDLDGRRGLSHFLAGGTEIDQVLVETDLTHLTVVGSGQVPPNPSELLASPRMTEFLSALAARFQVVIVDAPPVLAVTDASIVAPKTDGAVLVLRAGKTRTDMARAAVEQLSRTGARMLGAVVNDASRRDGFSYYNGYYSYS